MEKKDLSRRRMVFDSMGPWKQILSLMVTLFVFVALFVTLNSFHDSTQICVASRCDQAKAVRANLYNGSESETLKVRLRLDTSTETPKPTDLRTVDSLRIVVTHSESGLIQVDIPMRNGSTTSFPVILHQASPNQIIEISIFDSREFMITLDGSLVYSHRYFTPVFFADPTNPVELIQLNQYSHLAIVPHSLIITILTTPLLVSLGKIIDIIIIFLLIIFLIRDLLAKFFPQKIQKIQLEMPILGIISFWVVCIGSWLLRARDDTGATNPSPFAQIGVAFSDVMQIFQAGKFSNPYMFGAVNYPPTAVYLIRGFGPLSVGSAALIILAIPIGILLWLISGFNSSKNGIRNRLQIVPIILSYPLLFALIRGNLDLLVSALVGAALYFYIEKNYRMTALSILTCAAAIKFWPIVFVIFLAKKRDYSGIIFVGLGTLALTLVSSYLLGYHTIQKEILIIWNTLGLFNGTPSINTFIYSFSLGGFLLALSVFIAAHFSFHPTAQQLSQGFTFIESRDYLLILLVSVTLILMLIWKSKRTDSIILYCSALALFESSVSYAYRATVLIICIIVRINQSHSFFRVWKKPKTNSQKCTINRLWGGLEVLSWICILAPTTFHYVRGTSYSTSSVLQPIALLIILLVERKFEYEERSALFLINSNPNKMKNKAIRSIILNEQG